MSDATATAQTVVAIIAASVVVVGAIVLLAVIMLHRERKMQRELDKHLDAINMLRKDVDEKRLGHGKQFETLEDAMKPYKKHLLQSAFDLQSRLNGQVGHGSWVMGRWVPHGWMHAWIGGRKIGT